MARSALVRQPAAVVLAQAAGDRLPSYVTRDQARAIINAATTTTHRLLLETLWQSGGRVTEVLRLRPCDLAPGEPILHLVNLKQRPRRGWPPATQGRDREPRPGRRVARASERRARRIHRLLLPLAHESGPTHVLRPLLAAHPALRDPGWGPRRGQRRRSAARHGPRLPPRSSPSTRSGKASR
jgi:integrase